MKYFQTVMTYIFAGVSGALSANTVKTQTVVLLLLLLFVLSYYRMNSNSTNPFLDGLQFVDPVNLNDTFNFVPVSHSTPYVAPQHTSAIPPQQLVPTILVQPPPVLSDKTIKHFGGFMHEDASKFMKEFDSYLTLSSIDEESPRAIAAFHLHLSGPALIWFNNLAVKDSWKTVKAAFMNEYCNVVNNPSLIAESVSFDNLKLGSTQAIVDFHSVVLDKGRRLHKSDTDMTNKFIAGLPSQLAFFVRAGRVTSFRDALQSAKIGEAHGYRHVQGPPAATAETVNAASDSVQKQLDQITRSLDTLINKRPSQSTGTNPQQRNSRSCFKCKGRNHIKVRCNWNGTGESSPEIQCQICSQWGHCAPACIKLHVPQTQGVSTCQLCGQSSHTASQCPQLNQPGLGTMRNSQA